MSDLESMQESICRKYAAGFRPPDNDKMVGIADNMNSSELPINGLRHSASETSAGWYIWAGEYSDKKDFFKPMHLKHVVEKYPQVAVYLGLPPSWRFLIDPEQGYEDVWRDDTLIVDEQAW